MNVITFSRKLKIKNRYDNISLFSLFSLLSFLTAIVFVLPVYASNYLNYLILVISLFFHDMTRNVLPSRCLLFLACILLVGSWVFFFVSRFTHKNNDGNGESSSSETTNHVLRGKKRTTNEYCTSFYKKVCSGDGDKKSVFSLTKENNDALMLTLINETQLYHSCKAYVNDDGNGLRGASISVLEYVDVAIKEGLPFIVYVNVDKMLHKSNYTLSLNYDPVFCITYDSSIKKTAVDVWAPWKSVCSKARGKGLYDNVDYRGFSIDNSRSGATVDESFGYYDLNALCVFDPIENDDVKKRKECLHVWWVRTLKKYYGGGRGSGNITIKFNVRLKFLNDLIENIVSVVATSTNVEDLLYAYHYREAERKQVSFCFYVAKYLNLPHVNRVFYERTQVPGVALTGIVEGIRKQIRRMTRGSRWLSWDGVRKIDAKMDRLAIFFLGEKKPKEKVPLYEIFYGGNTLRRWCADKNYRKRKRFIRNDYVEDRLVEGYEDDPYETEFDIVNAWYKPNRNSITIPPGILQAPIYHGEDDSLNMRVNYVYLSSILAHEIGHSIDVHGLMFDELGNYRGHNEDGSDGYAGTFTKSDKNAFDLSTACLEKDYGNPCNRSDYGKNTLGEDMADQVGVYVSHNYFKEELIGMCSEFADENREMKCLKAFYMDYATIWCSNLTEEQKCNRVDFDVHALPADRVDKTLRQMKSFAKAFQCGYGDFMVNDRVCLIY